MNNESNMLALEIDVNDVEKGVTSVNAFVTGIRTRLKEIEDKHFNSNTLLSEYDLKNDKALINKVQKDINDYRIKKEREYLQPFNECVKEPLNGLVSDMKDLYNRLNDEVKKIEMQRKNEVVDTETIKVKYEMLIPNKNIQAKLEEFMASNGIDFKIK